MVGLVGPSRGSTRPKPPRPRARRAHRARVNARSRACTLASLPGTRARHRGSPMPTHPPDPAPPFRALSSVPTRAAAHPSADDRSARSLPYKGGEGAARRRRRRWRWQRRRRRRRRPRTAWLAQDCPLRELKRGPTTPPPERWCGWDLLLRAAAKSQDGDRDRTSGRAHVSCRRTSPRPRHACWR